MLKVSTDEHILMHRLSSRTTTCQCFPYCLLHKERIAFYDQYGVIRDVLQNHLTEVMTLLTMRLPLNLSNSQEVLQKKLNIFTSLLPLTKNQAVIGQYQAYQKEVQQELNKTTHVSLTPTFAGLNLIHFFNTLYTVLRYNG